MPDCSSLSDQEAVVSALNKQSDSSQRHPPAAMMGDPGLLEELPDIAALLAQGAADSEQAAAADGTTG